ncbi:transketolase [Streptomyces sp. DvalAA-14]|uniref:transketolase n=1 Tax=unclassified Streptomyces TaxID=2593676 RepID=UPI00081B7D58|nr:MULTISPECIES: transketolase [unclassified Streptomyces]MYS22668.1 transketolase [Streptomyces sp. SID4948]SCE20274.1 transketolase [Streptomyces sp. DvalAA-14]
MNTATSEPALSDAQIGELAQQLRVDAVRAADAAGSGHPTSSMSAADLIAVLLTRHLRYDFDHPEHPGNDHLIFSKGHASPLLYAAYKAVGAIGEEELLTTYRKLGSRLEGHPTPKLPWVDVATGSLGQGLPVAVGIAMAGKRLDHLPYRTWVLCGDSEMAEGSMWEAFEQAGIEGLDNLTAIIDVNRLGQRGPTRHGWDLDAYARRISAFGWQTVEIDGHDIDAVDEAMAAARTSRGLPTAIIARTRKGKGVAAVEDREGMHGKPLPDAGEAVRELGGVRDLRITVRPPRPAERQAHGGDPQAPLPAYDLGDSVATRTAFGEALTVTGTRREDVVVLDGEVGDSSKAELFAKEHPERYIECYIAEQQLIGTAVGVGVCGWTPYAGTFAAFLTRAYDFLRMAAISRSDLNVFGSHAGVGIGEDGPSQMALEDLAMMRAIHGSTVLYPCDANQTARLVPAMADRTGITYIRTSRGETPVIYGTGEEFPIGGSKVLRSGPDDEITLIGAGVTLHQALAAADRLADQGIRARVIDLYSVKPVDARTLRKAAEATGRFVTVEDHHPEGGLADAVLESFGNGHPMPVLTRLAVHAMPGSATPDEQLHAAGIDADAITAAARKLVGR